MGRPRRIADDDLLAAARAEFVEAGIAAPTHRIAERAGVSEALLYQRFGTKAQLFFAAMVPPAVDVEALLTPRDPATPPMEHWRLLAGRMLDYFRALVPVLLPLASHPDFDFEQALESHPDSPLGKLRTGLMRYLQAEAAAGTCRAEDTPGAALALFGALHSLALFEHMGAHGGRFDDAMVAGMVTTIGRGAGLDGPGGSA